jgi:hypothetical protein
MTAGKRATGRNGLRGYDRSKDAAWEGRSARNFARKAPAPQWPVLDAGGCWCGEKFGHDWPGKQHGAPHPRNRTEIARLDEQDQL